MPGRLSLREILRQHLLEVSPQRDEPRFMKFRVAHGEQGVGEVHIPKGQGDGFAHAEAGTIEQQYQRAQRVGLKFARVLPVRRGGAHEAAEFVVRVDMRDKAGGQLRHRGGQGRRGDDATADGIGVQPAQHAVLPVPIARHRARSRQESRDAVGVDVFDSDIGPQLPAKRVQHTVGTVKVLPHGLPQGAILRDHFREFHRKSPKSTLAT